MLWDSIDAIRAVEGSDYETAVITEERGNLSRYDAKSAHYEIASMQKPGELESVRPARRSLQNFRTREYAPSPDRFLHPEFRLGFFGSVDLKPGELSPADALRTIRFWACIPDHISLSINAGDEHGMAVLWATRLVHYVARTTNSHRSRVAQ